MSSTDLWRAHLAMSTCRWRSSARTHIGKVRLLNEDRYLDAPERGLWVVADGMGGHDAGDVAATAVVQALAELCAGSDRIDMPRIEASLQSVNQTVEAQFRARGHVGGCTVAGLHIDGPIAHAFWAGDSRAYCVRDGRLEQITHDHSVVQELMDAGLLNADQAARHPHANVITRAVGVAETLRLDVRMMDITGIERFLICSDGITSELTELELATCLLDAHVDHADAVVRQTLAKGARDNLTMIEIF